MNRRAFTMIEMLVALAATLIMMMGAVQLFSTIVESVSGSRALIETADKLRATRNRIQADLQGATATMKPPLRPENDEGYFELIEGVETDGNHPSIANTLFGDTDDALLLTVRSRGEPFVGKAAIAPNGTVESQVAEVAYFLVQDGPVMDATATPVPLRLFTLYRRAMLVYQPTAWTLPATVGLPFYLDYDVSARYDTVSATRIANTLGDLTKPENRFNRNGVAFPQRFLQPMAAFAGARLGDDILMTNVLSFDVQVYDPGAPVFVSGGVAVESRDQGYDSVRGGTPVAAGSYVDLGYLINPPAYTPPAGFPTPQFGGSPETKSGIPATRTPTNPYVYDTWSLHYENDGSLQTGAIADAATNGLDDDSLAGVDDIGERDTMPPYSAQLRAVRITIRVYEPSSLQVRQVTIVQDFLPE